MIKPKHTRGFSLVEVVFALAIVVFAVFAMIGLLLVGLQNGSDSKQRFQAATIAEAICSTLRAAPTVDFSAGTSPQPTFPLPALMTTANNFGSPMALTWDGQKATSMTDAAARFGLLYSIIAPSAGNYATSIKPSVSTVYLYVYWPARANPSSAGTSHFELTTTFALP